MQHKTEVSKKLKEIISRTYDSITIYSIICEELENAEIHLVCTDIISQKKNFVGELSAQLASMGEESINESNYHDFLVRPWIDSVNPDGFCDKGLIDQCVRAEWNASDDYDELLIKEMEVGSELYKIATNQRSMINQSLRKLEMLNKGIDIVN